MYTLDSRHYVIGSNYEYRASGYWHHFAILTNKNENMRSYHFRNWIKI